MVDGMSMDGVQLRGREEVEGLGRATCVFPCCRGPFGTICRRCTKRWELKLHSSKFRGMTIQVAYTEGQKSKDYQEILHSTTESGSGRIR